MMIPKKIHFIWIGEQGVPPWVDHLIIDRWEELNPDFQICRHDESILEYCSDEYREVFDKLEDVCSKSDVLRLAILRKFGGWYFDCDFVPLRLMKELYKEYDLTSGCFLTKQWEAGEKRIANGVMGMSTNAEAWKEIDSAFVEICQRDLERTSFGPLLTTRVVNRTPHVTVGRVEDFYPIRFQEDTWPILKRLVESGYSKQVHSSIFKGKNPFVFHMWLGGKKYAQPELEKLARGKKREALCQEKKRSLQVVCVLRSGGDFDALYVNKLHAGVERHLSIPHDFLCLTDIPEGIDCKTISLKHKWPGWWSKIELFRKDIFKQNARIIYFDLDTVIVGSIDDLAWCDCSFAMLKGFRHPERRASGMMMWEGDYSVVYEAFLIQEEQMLKRPSDWDQKFIDTHVSANYKRPTAVQDFVSGVYSYKNHIQKNHIQGNSLLPSDARIICFHGHPRPHEMMECSWMKENWK